MLNAGDLIKKRNGKNHIIHDLFKNKKNSKNIICKNCMSFWRIWKNSKKEIDSLNELGYSVGLNLMQVAGRSKRYRAVCGGCFGCLFQCSISPIVRKP